MNDTNLSRIELKNQGLTIKLVSADGGGVSRLEREGLGKLSLGVTRVCVDMIRLHV